MAAACGAVERVGTGERRAPKDTEEVAAALEDAARLLDETPPKGTNESIMVKLMLGVK